MRRAFFVLSVFLAACTGRPDPHLGFEPRDTTATADTTQLPVDPGGTVPVRIWRGTLEGGIPVRLGMAEDDGAVRGDVTYTATERRAPIRLLGTHSAEDGSYRLLEMGNDGVVTGIFTGTMQDRAFTGEWFSPKDRRTRPFRLEARDTLLTEADARPYRLRKGFQPGTYTYQYGPKDGPSGLLTATQAGAGRAGLTFSANRGAPSYNMADLQAGDVLLRNNWEVLYAPTDSMGSCPFRARFYTDFVVIDNVGGNAECGFGFGASIDGIYSLTAK